MSSGFARYGRYRQLMKAAADVRSAAPWAKQWHAQVEGLRSIEAQLAARPDDIALMLDRGRLLDEMGMRDDAMRAYLDVLVRERYHFEAMMRLGQLFIAVGNLDAAKAVFYEATVRHADVAAAHAALGNVLLDTGDAAGAKTAYRGVTEPVRVLLLMSAIGGNIPLQHVLDDRIFQWAELMTESYHDSIVLPPHTVVFNAIGDADRCTRSLRNAERVVARNSARLINDPQRVASTGRVANSIRLAQCPGVVTPRTEIFSRAMLLEDDAVRLLGTNGFRFPLLARSPGFHTGEHFIKVDGARALRGAIAELPGDELLVMEYLDTSGLDGTFRKYRVLFIDGTLYPLHLAVSPNWKVHYFTAAMAEEEAFRNEERAFLDDFERVLGSAAIESLHNIAATLGLDYGGIDFTLDRKGDVVVFEANATMVIVPPPADERFAYRKAAVDVAINAVRTMICGRC